MAHRKYTGHPFPPMQFAVMEDEHTDDPYPSFEGEVATDVATEQPRWIAKYKLVSVRYLKKRTTIRVVEVSR